MQDLCTSPTNAYANAMSTGVEPRVLVGRTLDGWLVGWLAVLVWIVAAFASRTGLALGPELTLGVYWIGAVVTAAHFGLSYHLAYSGGAPSLRARPVALVIGPAVLTVVLGTVVVLALHQGSDSVDDVATALITSVYLTTTWHYIKQVYGVGRVGAAFAGVPLDTWDTRILRFGLYPLWFLGAAQVLVRGGAYNLGGFRVGFQVLPYGTLAALRVLVIVSVVPVAAVFVRIALRRRAMPPGVLLAPYVATFLWLGFPANPALTLLLLAPFHALQYLAVGHRAELAIAGERRGGHGVLWWLNIVAGATCGGLLLGRWLPNLLDARFPSDRLLFAAAFFVFLNLHHYLIDASIWRSKGELVRAMGRSRAAAPATPPVAVRSLELT